MTKLATIPVFTQLQLQQESMGKQPHKTHFDSVCDITFILLSSAYFKPLTKARTKTQHKISHVKKHKVLKYWQKLS